MVSNLLRVALELDQKLQRLGDQIVAQVLDVEQHQRLRPIQGLADAGRLPEVEGAQTTHDADDLRGQRVRDARHLEPHDLEFARFVGVVDEEMQTAPLERVAQITGVVAGDDHRRRVLGPERAELRHRHLELAQDLQQKGLELLLRPVDLVDQQDHRLGGADRLQDRPGHDEVLGEEDVLVTPQNVDGVPEVVDVGKELADLVAQDLGVEQLLAVLPLVEGTRFVQPAVALEADQRPRQGTGRGLGQLGLADARRSLDQDRLLHPVREERDRRDVAVADIVVDGERPDGLVDRRKHARLRCVPAPW